MYNSVDQYQNILFQWTKWNGLRNRIQNIVVMAKCMGCVCDCGSIKSLSEVFIIKFFLLIVLCQ